MPTRIIAFTYIVLSIFWVVFTVRANASRRRKVATNRARQVNQLRLGYDKACRMACWVTPQTKAVFWSYTARVEQLAKDLNLTDIYPVGPVYQQAIRQLAGPRLVEV